MSAPAGFETKLTLVMVFKCKWFTANNASSSLGRDTQLVEDIAEVVLHSIFFDVAMLGNLLIRIAVYHGGNNFQLASCKSEVLLSRLLPGGLQQCVQMLH